jgi:hypothetical protein
MDLLGRVLLLDIFSLSLRHLNSSMVKSSSSSELIGVEARVVDGALASSLRRLAVGSVGLGFCTRGARGLEFERVGV